MEFSELKIPAEKEGPLKTAQWNDLVQKVERLYFNISANDLKVGLGTNDPKEALQIGDNWAFHSGGHKVIMYNSYWNGTNQLRITDGVSSELRFHSNGHLYIRTGPSGAAGTAVDFERTFSFGPSTNLMVHNKSNWMRIGASDDGLARIETNRPHFYFNREIRVDSGKIGSHTDHLRLCIDGKPRITIVRNKKDIIFDGDLTCSGDLTFKGKSVLTLGATSSMRLGPWEFRQTGGGKVTSYFYLDRYTTGGKNTMVKIDWSGNLKARGYVKGSDERTKKDIRSFTDGLNIIEKMRPVTYKYNGLGDTIAEQRDLGLIAQEVEKVAPYLVSRYKDKLRPTDKDKTELLNIKPLQLTYLLINAVKELNRKLETLMQTAALKVDTEIKEKI
ncbi:tail fiber domain-containing protein [Flavilitoribacter nigricans]|uniref:Peptidase S74 domain-containing protein n=1 Tax=Flavilitoribacter nigricans (strain ATCC 23147 / DSM 23189 / NBRC 102662 / NCIMB 1420 / SS-2) TaxID=1122177 RepID=A0A2D0N0V2_FLAN2|nr:tail fiber domain-containing protein [Flavilitoribacter nigricans]PHN01996.1 hypothetical protein CRP01_34385 [Flavilitoribacter nigricans DSM 23189 = NBRC 102662]